MLWIVFRILTFVCSTADSQPGQSFYYSSIDNQQQAQIIPYQQDQFSSGSPTFAAYLPQPFRSAANYRLIDGNSVTGQKFQLPQQQQQEQPLSALFLSQSSNTPSDPRLDSIVSSAISFVSRSGSSDDYVEIGYPETVAEVPSQRFNTAIQESQSASFRHNKFSHFPSVAVSKVTRTQNNPNNSNVLQSHSFNLHHAASHPTLRHTDELPLTQVSRWRSQIPPGGSESFNFRARNIPFAQYGTVKPPESRSTEDDLFPHVSNRFAENKQTSLVNTHWPESVDGPKSQSQADLLVPHRDPLYTLPNKKSKESPSKERNNQSWRKVNSTLQVLPTTYSPFILLDNRVRNTPLLLPSSPPPSDPASPSATELPIDVITTIRPSMLPKNSHLNNRRRNKYTRPNEDVSSKWTTKENAAVKSRSATTTQERAVPDENTNFDVVTTSPDHMLVSDDNFNGFVDNVFIDSADTASTEDLKDALEDATVAGLTTHAPLKKKVLLVNDTKSARIAENRSRNTVTVHGRKSTARAVRTTTVAPNTFTEGWIIVASVQTSRSVSGARFIPSSAIKQEQHPLPSDVKFIKVIRDVKPPHADNNQSVADSTHRESTSALKTITPTANTANKSSAILSTEESIIDKLDQVQSELSSGILNAFQTQEKHTLDSAPIVSATIKSADSINTKEAFSSKETFTLRFTPSSQTTSKPKVDRNKSLFDNVQFDDLAGLLPAGFKSRGFMPQKLSHVSKSTKSIDPSIASSPSSSLLTAFTSTEKSNRKDGSGKSNSLSNLKFKIKFDDVSALLPPGYEPPLEESTSVTSSRTDGNQWKNSTVTTGSPTVAPLDRVPVILSKAKPVDVRAFLPPGFRLQANFERPEVTSKKADPVSSSDHHTEEMKSTAEPGSGIVSKVVFPSRSGGDKKPQSSLPKGAAGSSKPRIPSHQPPDIHKGWPVRVSTEFTGWPTPSPSPISIEKLLQTYKEATAKEASLEAESATSTSTTTTTTTTTSPTTTGKSTTPGICFHDCDLAGAIKLIGGVKWVPELLDHNTKEWRALANDVQHQLETVFQSSEVLSKWYRKISVDAFSPGSVVVDYFLELSDLGRTVNTADIKRYFHDTLVQETVASNSFRLPNNSDYPQLKLGKYIVDPTYIDFVVLPRSVMPAIRITEEEAWLPQWAVAVVVIGLASLCFVIIFGITVIISKHKSAKKHPTALTEEMLNELNKGHMSGFENYGADNLYYMEDVWNEKPFKKRSSYYQENNMPNIYDSWRSDWNGYYGNSYYNGSVRSGYSRRRSDYDTNF